MSNNGDLQTAILCALQSHDLQEDKQGQPYILHCLRVMLRCEGDSEAMQVAVMHDVLEDTHYTAEDLRELGFSPRVVEAVQVLTRRKGAETYAEYIERIKENSLAVRVKFEDLHDNLARADSLPPLEAVRLGSRYRKALKDLFRARVVA